MDQCVRSLAACRMGTNGLWYLVLATALYCSHCEAVYKEVLIVTSSYGAVSTCVLEEPFNCTSRQSNYTYPYAPVYDPVEDYIYWYDRRTVFRTPYLDDNAERWKNLDTDILDFQIDPSVRLLFVTMRDLITINLTTKEETVVIKDARMSQLSLDKDDRKIYYQDDHNIGVMNYDGSGRQSNFTRLFELTLDLAFGGAGQLYYTDTQRELFSLDTNTNTSQLLRDKCVQLAVSGGNVYCMEFRGKVFVLNQTAGPDFHGIENSEAELHVGHLTVSRRRVSECPAGMFGWSCSSKCGQCLNGDICNERTGVCPRNCESLWTGQKCDIVLCGASVESTGNRVLNRRPTQVGKTFYTDGICHKDGKPLGSSACVEDGRGGAVWEPFTLNPACNISSLPESEISMSLRDILQNDTTSSTQSEEVVKKTRSLTKNRTLSVLDVLHITDILEIASQPQQISTQVALEVVEIVNTVSESDDDVITGAEEAGQVVNRYRLFLTMDSVTAKLEVGPSGNSEIRTETFESELWDLTHENITSIPIGFVLKESPTDTSTSTLYNETLDYPTADCAIVLPQDFVHGLVNGSPEKSVLLSMNIYRKPLQFPMTEEMKREKRLVLDSKVIAAKLLVDGVAVTDLGDSQVTFITTSYTATNEAKRVCGYWNFTTGGWFTDGCNHTGVSDGKDICVCDHLTNFALLLDLDGESVHVSSGHPLALNIITTAGLSLSVIGLSVTIITYLIFRNQLKKEAPRTTFNLCVSQLCAWVVFLVGFNQTQSKAGCILSGVLLHYFILASFLWMSAEALLAYLLLVKVYKSGVITLNYMWKTGLPAWILPAVPVITVLGIDPDLYKGRHCWMSGWTSLFAFTIPIGLIVLCNAVFYGLVVFKMCTKKTVGQTRARRHKENMINVRVSSFFCFVLFGLSWVFGFLAVADHEAKMVFQYIFCATASTQGFLIFILFTVRNEEVKDRLYTLCCGNTKTARKDVNGMVVLS